MKIVLAYSGGLDTSVIVRWLIDQYQAEVVAYIADLGQEEDLPAIRRKALKTGAKTAVVEDLREEFARDFLFPMLRANAVYEGGYLMGTSIARPLIAKGQVRLAERVRAEAVSHGSTGKGNDQVRFELTYQALNPGLKIIAPWREWDFRGREDLIKYARSQGIPVPVTKAKPYSSDRNIFHISYEGGILEDPWREPTADMFVLTRSPEKAPARPEYVEITYAQGNPVALNGRPLSPFQLISRLNLIAGRHGVGRVDMVENRFVGIRSRGVYETPAGTVLHLAHRAVESLTLDREVMHLRDSLISRYSESVYYGFWYAPERLALQALVDEAQRGVSGVARIKLFKGSAAVAGRRSEKSLYRSDYATFEKDTVYDQRDATGFIRLNALRLKIGRKLVGQKAGAKSRGKKKVSK
ncbi:MAG: argininosuccinate synthase [bacterium]|nr:argininosuccinate synthase [bacterium]